LDQEKNGAHQASYAETDATKSPVEGKSIEDAGKIMTWGVFLPRRVKRSGSPEGLSGFPPKIVEGGGAC